MTITSNPIVRVNQLWASLAKKGVTLQVIDVHEDSGMADVLILTNSDFVQGKLDAGFNTFPDRRGTSATISLSTLTNADPRGYVLLG